MKTQFKCFIFIILASFAPLSLVAMDKSQKYAEKENYSLSSIIWDSFLRPIVRVPQTVLTRLFHLVLKPKSKIPCVVQKNSQPSEMDSFEVDMKNIPSVPMIQSEEFGLQQVCVCDQTSVQHSSNSGGASCGYHALKNGILLAQEQFDTLLDETVVSNLFSTLQSNLKVGFWRREIMHKRLQSILSDYIKEQMIAQFIVHNVVQHPYQKEVRDVLLRIIDDLVKDVVKTIMESSGKSCTVTTHDIKHKIERLNTSKTSANDEYTQRLSHARSLLKQDSDNLLLSQFLNIKADGKTFSEHDADLALEFYNNKAEEKGLSKITISGDWLDSGELDILCQLERKQGILLSDQNIEVSIIEDIGLIDIPEVSPCNFEEIGLKLSQNPRYKHIFIIGTMGHNHQTGTGSMGHWFTVVVTSKGAFVADSLANMNRLTDHRVQAVLKKLGKEEWISKPQGYTELIEQKIEKTFLELEDSIKKNDEKNAAMLQFVLMKQQEHYQRFGGKIDYQNRAQTIIELGLAAAKQRDQKRKQLHEEIVDLFDTEKNLEKLQMSLIPKQFECEQLGLSFEPYEKQLQKIISDQK